MGIRDTAPTEQIKRDALQNLFDRSFKTDDRERIREYYKTLRKLEMSSKKCVGSEVIDIAYLVENLTSACDIVTSETDRNFVFCGNDTASVKGNSKLISKAVLNLLSNAFLYSRENLVVTKTVETDRFVKIEVRSGGEFIYNSIGAGLQFVRDVCKCHGGYFLLRATVFP